jgi:hypothetical protein
MKKESTDLFRSAPLGPAAASTGAGPSFPRISDGIDPFDRAMATARAAMVDLNALGIQLIGLDTVLPRPVIAILPPAEGSLQGSHIFSISLDDKILRCYVACYGGCLVRWFIDYRGPVNFPVLNTPEYPIAVHRTDLGDIHARASPP